MKEGDKVFITNGRAVSIVATARRVTGDTIVLWVENGHWEMTITVDNSIQGKDYNHDIELFNRTRAQ